MRWGFAKEKPVEQGPDTVQLAVCDERLAEVSRLLKRCLPKKAYPSCWSKWRPILQRNQLFSGAPFKNIVDFVKSVAAEHGLDHDQEKALRKAMFALSFNDEEHKSKGKTTFQVRRDQINNIRFHASGMDKFQKATMVVTSPSTVVLTTKRGLLLGSPVKILMDSDTGDAGTHSALLFHGSIRKISTFKTGSRYKYLVKVKNTELKTAAG